MTATAAVADGNTRTNIRGPVDIAKAGEAAKGNV
jgi:hypothetical protein